MVNTYLTLNESKSEKLSKSVDSLFKSMRMSLQQTSNFLASNEGMSDEEIQEHLELLRGNSRYFNSLSWVDETGLIRSIAPISVGLRGEVINGVTKDVLDLKKPNLTTPYIAPSGRLIVLMSEPIYDDQAKYRGMVGGTIYLQEKNVLNEILGNDLIDDNGSYYYVVGPEGKLLFHPDIDRVGEDVSANPMVQKLLLGESGTQRVTNTKGTAMLAAYSYVPETGWGVVQQTPVSYIEVLLDDHIQTLILYVMPPFLILLMLSILLARKLARPFNHLSELVNQLAAGKVVEIPETLSHWNREADILTKSVLIAIESVQENNHKLTEVAMTDSLTNLPNQRKFNQVMESWILEKKLFSLIVLDIDHFKLVNDTYGHKVGDEVLKEFSEVVQSTIRKTDLFFRYGGEEFVLLLPDINSIEAHRIAEKIRVLFENRVSVTGDYITISIGISEFPLHSASFDELFIFADRALYQSKENGRNTTTIWSEDQMPVKKE
ncbi:diguanylate cyclase (GGDEF)-like protein [Bacillus mesophilus]|uniref:GGDEF domain-containing protein n=1 Tax=Bacillus mesophilus TaxID=1808955 RepID=A0A6M0QBU1_9BACI|nr:sensor domain-containing diguanylate cyclase [Bacillus mesophilus]MBM7660101.1 diguanylate cyclase (GGDEF)-like protein [Bacillus mesophilus]NEY73756.1 GGDEF domain-containing protein [Bacillus mesophilus]